MDSGAAGNLISPNLLTGLQLATQRLEAPLTVKALDGHPVGNDMITSITNPVQMMVGCDHQEELQFLVLLEKHHTLVLGLPWFQQHDPVISWWEGRIVSWSPHCHCHCTTHSCTTTTIKGLITAPSPAIPPKYNDILAVFSKDRATCLSSHHLWDCAIDLLVGASPAQSRIYPFSIPEIQAMEEYMEEALKQGFVRPSTSPTSEAFFFVENKGEAFAPVSTTRISMTSSGPLRYRTAVRYTVYEAPLFTTAPILKLPDLTKPFIAEVDTYRVGVGAVHSQCQGDPPKMFACALFVSPGSSPPPRGTTTWATGSYWREKLAEEWRHWLEGSLEPSTVLTDQHREVESNAE